LTREAAAELAIDARDRAGVVSATFTRAACVGALCEDDDDATVDHPMVASRFTSSEIDTSRKNTFTN